MNTDERLQQIESMLAGITQQLALVVELTNAAAAVTTQLAEVIASDDEADSDDPQPIADLDGQVTLRPAGSASLDG